MFLTTSSGPFYKLGATTENTHGLANVDFLNSNVEFADWSIQIWLFIWQPAASMGGSTHGALVEHSSQCPNGQRSGPRPLHQGQTSKKEVLFRTSLSQTCTSPRATRMKRVQIRASELLKEDLTLFNYFSLSHFSNRRQIRDWTIIDHIIFFPVGLGDCF